MNKLNKILPFKKCAFCDSEKQLEFELNGKTIKLCKICCMKLYQEISKNIVPKSPKNLFLSKKENE